MKESTVVPICSLYTILLAERCSNWLITAAIYRVLQNFLNIRGRQIVLRSEVRNCRLRKNICTCNNQ